MNMEKKYVNEKGHFLMSLKEAQDLFSIGNLSIVNLFSEVEVENLSIVMIKNKSVLKLEDKVHGWTTHFWKAQGSLKFCDMKTAHHVAKKLGFKPRYNTEVSMSLVGKKVMVKVFDTNTRPMFTEVGLVEDALDLGFELGKSKNKFYLKKDGEIFKKGKVINDDYRYNILADHNPDPPYLRRWEVRIKKIVLDKIVCRCTYMADYSFYPDNDQSV